MVRILKTPPEFKFTYHMVGIFLFTWSAASTVPPRKAFATTQYFKAAAKFEAAAKSLSLHDAKFEVRERLSHDHIKNVPADFSYESSTHAFYQDATAGHIGRYCVIRKSLDPEYHGRYSEDRQRLQDELLDDVLGSVRGRQANPWIIFTAGAMGSGKSRTFEWMAEQGIVPLQQMQILDPDMFKASLPEWRGLLDLDPLQAGFRTRKESGFLLEIAQESALRDRKHIWVDGSLRDGEWYRSEFERIRQEYPAYKIAIVHVVASRAVVLQRVQDRAAVTGRHVPISEIDDSLKRVPRSVGLLAPLVEYAHGHTHPNASLPEPPLPKHPAH